MDLDVQSAWTDKYMGKPFQIRIIPQLAFLFFSIPYFILALLSCPLLVKTQIRGHIAGPSSPSPLRYVPSIFYREKNSAFSSFVDSFTSSQQRVFHGRLEAFVLSKLLLCVVAFRYRISRSNPFVRGAAPTPLALPNPFPTWL